MQNAEWQAEAEEPQNPTVLWLIRHAEVEERYQGVFGGRIDMGLSARGRQQAEALARFLQGRAFQGFYASPMVRVQQTLAPLLAMGNGLPQPTIVPELREVDFGDWTGLSWGKVLETYGVSAFSWLDQLEADAVPNAESGKVLRARVEPCVRRILSQHHGQQVVLACHGGVIRMILSVLLDLPLPKTSAFEVEYASVSQILCSTPKPTIQLHNFTPWRELNGSWR